MRIRLTYLTVMLAARPPLWRPLLSPHHRLRPTVFHPAGPTRSPYARRVNPGSATRHPSLGPLLISLLTVMWTGCATRASASLWVTEAAAVTADPTVIYDKAALSSPPSSGAAAQHWWPV